MFRKPFLLLEEVNPKSEIQVLSVFDKYNTIEAKVIVQTLQSTLNKNERTYDKDVFSAALKRIQPLIKQKRLLGELDHPVEWIENPYRLFSVAYRDASHVFKKVWIEGNTVYAIIRTLPTEDGIKLKNLILCEDVNVGFSLRANGDSTGVNKTGRVIELNIVTWDAVSNPSEVLTKVVSYNKIFESCQISKLEQDYKVLLEEEKENTCVKHFNNGLRKYALQKKLNYWGV